ncbi:hypothetical protein [Paractinoplanes atraurantiacus]|uniref:Lipoprotein n=1 Tax=Paractinoplanes atraurantiacus TaxID=1036182 RepID=A0A285ICP1_9ACTN|nr:hypothetical protein [Actinoplanes atraurantiacus]SNY45745.1 hypothetical protein SAMN05421748_107285 [Actinoplanes atraurantiacus]
MRRWIVGMALAVVAAGCAGPVPADKRAREILARYDEAVRAVGDGPRFVPAGPLTDYAGALEERNEQYQDGIGAGLLEAVGALPGKPEQTGQVTWRSGDAIAVPLIGAPEALGRVNGEGVASACPGCAPVPVTGARLTTVPIATSRGVASVPAWEFTLADSAFRVTRVAVADSAAVRYTPPAGSSGAPAAESATLAGNALTVTFTGAEGPASETCGADYTARTVESPNAVVVVISAKKHRWGFDSCDAVGHARTATVELAEPLGERPVLDVEYGMPVPLEVGPR